MATHNLFKGIKRVLANNTAYTATTNNDYLYFVRESGATEGDIWFQGVHYGHFGANDLTAIETALAGFLTGQGEQGYKNVKQYIDDLIGGKDASVSGESADKHVKVQVDEADGALTAVTVTTEDIASAEELDAVEAGLGFVGGTAYTNSGQYISGDTVAADIDRLDTAIVDVQGDFNREVDAIETAVGLNADGTHQTQSGKYISGATTVEGEIIALNNAIEAMDVSEISEAGKPIVAISQTDGVVSAATGNINAEFVDIADEAGLFDATNVEEALAELAGKAAAITISNADGSINVTTSSTGTDINVNIKSGEKVLAKDGSAGLYTDIKLSGVTPSSTTIKEEYALIGTDGSQLGETVKIYKDSSLVSMQLVEETVSGETKQLLRYTYIDNSGDTQTTDVDVSLLLAESEFKDGLQVNGAGEVSVKRDSTSENFLSVSSNGVKVSGIQDAIDAAETAATAYTQTQIEALDYADTAVTGQYVSEVDETNGVISVQRANVSEAALNNYSKGSDATAVAATDTVNQAISKLENQVDAAKAAATTKVEKDANANHITLSSATSVSDGSVTYTIGESDIASATALTETASTLYNMVTAETHTRESEDDRLEELISGLTDDLEAEIAARKAVDGQNGDTYAANTGANYISGATNLNDADVKLDTALKGVDDRLDTVEEKYLTGVTVNGVDATVSANKATVTIDAGDIQIGDDLSGETVSALATDKVDDVLQSIITALDAAYSGAYTGLTSSDDSLVLSGTTNGQDIIVNREDVTVMEAQDGHIELLQNNSGELYGAMYWIDEETSE